MKRLFRAGVVASVAGLLLSSPFLTPSANSYVPRGFEVFNVDYSTHFGVQTAGVHNVPYNEIVYPRSTSSWMDIQDFYVGPSPDGMCTWWVDRYAANAPIHFQYWPASTWAMHWENRWMYPGHSYLVQMTPPNKILNYCFGMTAVGLGTGTE